MTDNQHNKKIHNHVKLAIILLVSTFLPWTEISLSSKNLWELASHYRILGSYNKGIGNYLMVASLYLIPLFAVIIIFRWYKGSNIASRTFSLLCGIYIFCFSVTVFALSEDKKACQGCAILLLSRPGIGAIIAASSGCLMLLNYAAMMIMLSIKLIYKLITRESIIKEINPVTSENKEVTTTESVARLSFNIPQSIKSNFIYACGLVIILATGGYLNFDTCGKAKVSGKNICEHIEELQENQDPEEIINSISQIKKFGEKGGKATDALLEIIRSDKGNSVSLAAINAIQSINKLNGKDIIKDLLNDESTELSLENKSEVYNLFSKDFEDAILEAIEVSWTKGINEYNKSTGRKPGQATSYFSFNSPPKNIVLIEDGETKRFEMEFTPKLGIAEDYLGNEVTFGYKPKFIVETEGNLGNLKITALYDKESRMNLLDFETFFERNGIFSRLKAIRRN